MTHTSKAAKMAREMLAADRRAQKRRHRARRAHAVHTAPLIRPEIFEQTANPSSVGPVARHTCRAADAIDFLLTVILWVYAFACVAITIALFTQDLISK